jgi:hypothetical protein
MVIRRYIVSGSDVSNITNMLIASPNFTASFHSTGSCGIDNLVYCNVEWEWSPSNDLASILRSIDNASDYCDDHDWLVEPVE